MSEVKVNPEITAVDVSTAMEWATTPVNLFVQLADGRYLVVLRKGNAVDKDRLQKYLTKGVKTLFASDRDLVNDALPNIKEIKIKAPGSAEEAKIKALEKVSEAVFDELLTLGITETSFQHAKVIGKAIRGMIEKDASLSDAFEKFQSLGRAEIRHSMMVSAMATVIASSMESSKPSTIENIAMGALLHDFGKLGVPAEVLESAPNFRSQADRKSFESHAENGRVLLAQVKVIPEDIQMIVAQHHERSDGSGYPLGLKDIYIHPLARVVGLANEIIDRYEAEKHAGRETTVRSLVETLVVSQSTKFNRDLIRSLREMLNSEKEIE